MFICISKITFNQQPNDSFPDRKRTLIYNFAHSFEAEDNWTSLTNTAKITIPKNVYVIDENGNKIPLAGTNVNAGGFSDNRPLFLRGDRVIIQSGYQYLDNSGNWQSVLNTQFTGFISNVSTGIPIELECQDNMYVLKQLMAPNKVFPEKSYTLESILTELLKGTGFTVRKGVSTTFGDFRTQNETVCEVLARLRKDYHFESYFRGNELRCGFPIYVESDAVTKRFLFNSNPTESVKFGIQGAVIKNDLKYNRKDDINLSAIAYSVNKNELHTTTKDGHQKTKHERLEVLVTVRNGKFVSSVKPAGQKADFAPNTAGERRTFYFWNVKTTAELINLATVELQKYYYSGFRGTFTTFGLPFVRMGDNVTLVNNLLPEQDGTYKVKSVKYFGGVNGHRQEIGLDFKIS